MRSPSRLPQRAEGRADFPRRQPQRAEGAAGVGRRLPQGPEGVRGSGRTLPQRRGVVTAERSHGLHRELGRGRHGAQERMRRGAEIARVSTGDLNLFGGPGAVDPLRSNQMLHVTADAAAARLPDLMERAQGGESVIIVLDDHAVQLVPIALPKAARPRPRFGSAAGQVHMAPDFDAPLEDFADYTK
jgi:antitoxin (DNA-binding transcriptional repressor) of toxin-antitoxin stability system